MIHRQVLIAASILAGSSSALAAAPTPARAAAVQPAKPQQLPTRATMVRNLDAGFKAIDTNGDGNLSTSELAAAEGRVQQQRLAQIRARVEAEFAKLDTNRDNSLSKSEFMAAAPTAPATAPNGAALLTRLDTSKDGKVTVDEYRRPQLAAFDRIDTNKDGTISPAERAAAQAAAAKTR